MSSVRVGVVGAGHISRTPLRPWRQAPGCLLDEVPDDVEVIGLGASNILTGAVPLRRLLGQESPDILFSTSSGTNITSALALRRPGPRLVLSERNGLVRDQPAFKLTPLLFAKRRLYPRADCVTAVSRGVANDLEHRLGLASTCILTVYNPVTTTGLRAQCPPEPSAADWLGGDTPLILAAGRLVHAKGFDVLLRAFAITRRQTECRLIILGEGPLRQSLRKLAARLGCSAQVLMPGFVADPFVYMQRSTIFALSSRFEGLPGVLIQAMACGAPVVATDCPFGPAEIVSHDRDGMLVPPEDPERLAQALSSLLSSPGKRSELARAARISAQRFTLKAIMPNYVKALDPEP